MNFLLIEVNGERKVIPLVNVVRLEEFERSRIEKSGEKDVVQYRDEIMPLIVMPGSLDMEGGGKLKVQVVVLPRENKHVGLVVDNIVDIVQSDVDSKKQGELEKGSATLIIKDRVTSFLNIADLVSASWEG